MPDKQAEQFTEAAESEKKPRGHRLHTVCPETAWKNPLSQLAQTVSPCPDEYVPAVQEKHCPIPFPSRPSAPYVPGLHKAHLAVPLDAENFPATHLLHVNHSLSSRHMVSYPLSHRHWSSLAPSIEVEYDGHARQPGFTPSV